MNRFLDTGGGHYDSGTVLAKYDAGSCDVVNPGTVNCYLSVGYTQNLRKTLTVNASQLTMGFRYRCTVLPGSDFMNVINFLETGNYLCHLGVDAVGRLNFYKDGGLFGTTIAGVSPQNLIRPNVWCYVEIEVLFASAATGTVEIRHNGVPVLHLTGLSTALTYSACNQVDLSGTPNGLGPNIFKDIYINDPTPEPVLGAGVNTSFWGDTPIYCIFPASDAEHNDLTPSSGGNRYSLVNEHVPNTANYVSGDTAGQIQTFHMDQLPNTAQYVNAMQHLMYVEKDDAGARRIKPMISDGATDVAGTEFTVNGGYNYFFANYDRDPVTNGLLTPTIVNQRRQGVEITL